MERAFKNMRGALRDQAFDSEKSKGRRNPLHSFVGDNIDPFLMDFSAAARSPQVARLFGKAQVFANPDRVGISNRGIHTNDVIAIAVAICDALGLNIFLGMAIALMHDFWHTPYGHLGERILSDCTGHEFRHNIYGAVMLQYAIGGYVINPSWEVLKGVEYHPYKKEDEMPEDMTPEMRVAALSDFIAFMCRDPKDFLDYERMVVSDFPKSFQYLLGKSLKERQDICIDAFIRESIESGKVSFFHSEVAQILWEARNFMYSEGYGKIDHSLSEAKFCWVFEYMKTDRRLRDYDTVAMTGCMTDAEIDRFAHLGATNRKISDEELKTFSFTEVIPVLSNQHWIDFTNPDLSWGDMSFEERRERFC